MKPTHLPAGKARISVTLPEETKAALLVLAGQSGMSLNEYCSSVLESAASRSAVLRRDVREVNPAQGKPPAAATRPKGTSGSVAA